jgi:hypothetical protein
VGTAVPFLVSDLIDDAGPSLYPFDATPPTGTIQTRLLNALFLSITPFFITLMVSIACLALVAAVTLIIWLRRRDSTLVAIVKRADFFKLAIYDERGKALSITRSVFGALITCFAIMFAVCSIAFLGSYYASYNPAWAVPTNSTLPNNTTDSIPIPDSQNSVKTITLTSIGDSSSKFDPVIESIKGYSQLSLTVDLLNYAMPTCSYLRSGQITIQNCFDSRSMPCAPWVNPYPITVQLPSGAVVPGCRMVANLPTPHFFTGTVRMTIDLDTSYGMFTAARVIWASSQCLDPTGS